jgi:predicted short-subunit dehydrogenase-like oxidoreductase (DUF2520 family)
MRQVPQYLLIGSGRVARHFQYYFSLVDIPFLTWHRKESLAKLNHQLKQASHVLLLISDKAIDLFITEHLQKYKTTLIHFSGSLISKNSYGAHPLMTFNDSLYTLEQYQSIPFIIDHDAPEFTSLLPGLNNQHVRLHTSQKSRYHALCVLSGNFSCLLWQKLISTMENDFQFPKEITHSYLMQQTRNLLHHPDTALTGPLVRNDMETIQKNINSLADDPFQDIYKSFVSCYHKLNNMELL